MTPNRMPVVSVGGKPEDIGRAHGESLREEIGYMREIYGLLFGMSEEQIETRAATFEQATRAWHAELADEIDGIAAGANVPRYWIHALNARSEFVSQAGKSENECTSVYFDDQKILGQNWDWLQELEPLTRILDVTHADGHRIMTVTEPGIVAKIGLSSAGVGVGLNFLFTPAALNGVPVHVLLRALLDLRDAAEIDELIDSAGHGRAGHVLVGNAHAPGLGLEFTGKDTHRISARDGVITHTNHFLCEEIDPGVTGPNSNARLARANGLLPGPDHRDWQSLRSILEDADGSDHPICRPFLPTPNWPSVKLGSVCAVVMELKSGTLRVRLGPDPKGSWQTHRLTDANQLAAAE